MNDSRTRTRILGISAFYHDSAAALVIDGKVVAAAHEERFTRKRHDENFPIHAIRYVLEEYGLNLGDLEAIVFYDKPYLKFERLLETYHTFAPRGLRSFVTSMPTWVKDKVFMKGNIWKSLEKEFGKLKKRPPPLLFTEHHLSHAASAFYPSSFEDAAILTIDGVGEWATTTIGYGKGNKISLLKEMHFPHSLGLLYSAFTYYCGFKVNSGEYKLMGLAPYGHKDSERVLKFKNLIKENIVSLKDDGSIALNMDYFDFATDLRMCKDEKWTNLLGVSPRKGETEITEEYMDLALAIQEITEEVVIKLAFTAKKITGSENLVMAGGVALNCVANHKIVEQSIFENVWIQPAAGDAGGALGAALAAYYLYFDGKRSGNKNVYDEMQGAYLGPEFSENDTMKVVRKYDAKFRKYDSLEIMCDEVAKLLSEDKVVGWMQGKMEWGPRALGNRSILGNPLSADTQKKLNLKIKYREGFRPFAPSVLIEDVSTYFDTNKPSPYMLFIAMVNEDCRKPLLSSDKPLYERLYQSRSDVPSITHLDYSARIQTVSKDTNLRYWKLINAFKAHTGYGMVVNTSFNVRNEPIVCTPEDAYRCFMNTEMDYLVIGDLVFNKKDQPRWNDISVNEVYGLD